MRAITLRSPIASGVSDDACEFCRPSSQPLSGASAWAMGVAYAACSIGCHRRRIATVPCRRDLTGRIARGQEPAWYQVLAVVHASSGQQLLEEYRTSLLELRCLPDVAAVLLWARSE